MNTDGPAMSFFTSCWLLPQNEQYSNFSPLEDFLSDIRHFGWNCINNIAKSQAG
jgi:hypothetical protein